MYRLPNTWRGQTFGGRLRDGGLPYIRAVLGSSGLPSLRATDARLLAAQGAAAPSLPARYNRASLPRTAAERWVGARAGQPANRASLPRQASVDATMTRIRPALGDASRARLTPEQKLRRQADLEGIEGAANIAGHEVGAVEAYLDRAPKPSGVVGQAARAGARAAGGAGLALDAVEGAAAYQQRRERGEEAFPAAAKEAVKTGSGIAGAMAGGAVGAQAGPGGAALGAVAGGVLTSLGHNVAVGAGDLLKDYLRMYKEWERQEIMRRAFGLPRIR